MGTRPTSFETWQATIPQRIRKNPLWNFVAYPKALFMYDLVWFDCEKLEKERRGRAIEEQIIRSAGSISANIEEGYGRGLGADYARFLKFALGSARETQGWYLRARHLLTDKVLDHRLALLDEIIALLVTTIAQQKSKRTK
ncbi:MAG: four helix bundle protein [Chloroflexi bacterium]|nr:four helix bundle protein [Chloroflexota bacterium]